MRAAAPALPATTLVADFARVAPRLPVETAGATVEVEGVVASASTSTFVVRGVTVDTSALPAGTALPGTGDVVRVVGTIATSGNSVTASSLTIVHAANSVNLGLEGDAGNVSRRRHHRHLHAVGTRPDDHRERADAAGRHVGAWLGPDAIRRANPFNITTFQSYLAASTSKHVVVKAGVGLRPDALVARSLAIVPASSEVAVAGVVDATPAVVNSTVTGTPTTFSVHGIAVKADPAAIRRLAVHAWDASRPPRRSPPAIRWWWSAA